MNKKKTMTNINNYFHHPLNKSVLHKTKKITEHDTIQLEVNQVFSVYFLHEK